MVVCVVCVVFAFVCLHVLAYSCVCLRVFVIVCPRGCGCGGGGFVFFVRKLVEMQFWRCFKSSVWNHLCVDPNTHASPRGHLH